jgi:uncharacterized protein (DUF302 family)
LYLQGENKMAFGGLTTIVSHFGPKETLDRFEDEVRAKGLTVFARIDHAAGAAAVGMTLLPTAVLIFGNARGGTPLMQASQVIGIDLPLRVLVWQDTSGKTWLSYYDPSVLAERYGLAGEMATPVGNLSAALRALTAKAAAG